MNTELKLIIADDEPFICGMLEKLIHFEELGIKLIGTVHDGVTLTEQIREETPDIVLTDISMPQRDGLEVIRYCKEHGYNGRFIIISGYKQFEYAYNALKYSVDDYILKPVEEEELNKVLKRLSDEIRHKELLEKGQEKTKRDFYFIETAAHKDLKNSDMSLPEVNRVYHTGFSNGCFRMLMLKLDFLKDMEQLTEDNSSVINKLKDLVEQEFRGSCYDIVLAEIWDGPMFLLNYAETRQKDIDIRMREIFVKAQNLVELFMGITVTLCIGVEVTSVKEIEITKNSCRRASWLRMLQGINRVIYEEKIENCPSREFIAQFQRGAEELEKSFIALDISGMEQSLDKLFALPGAVLGSRECMMCFREIIKEFAEIYGKVMHDAVGAERIRENITKKLHGMITFKTYRFTMEEELRHYMEMMKGKVREKNVKPIRQAMMYIEEKYNEDISLERMAAEVGLSPIYFSNLFKKESGKNYIEYLTAFKMEKAKELLKEGKCNINEIAAKLGYSDARYFSKVFKKEVGIKPTEYRKIYG